MKYSEKSCPVCKKQFEPGEDIVVCPECGTPYHRECYDKSGECVYKDRHGMETEDEAYPEKEDSSESVGKVCPRCGKSNRDKALFCDGCGLPFNSSQYTPQYSQGGQNPPRETFVNMFDPLAGFAPDEEFTDNVTAGELAKYIRVNTPYYMSVFRRIRNTGTSKFNFAGMLFSGCWLLYRKQYLKGGIVTGILAVLFIAYLYTIYLSDILIMRIYETVGLTVNSTSQEIQSAREQLMAELSKLNASDLFIMIAPLLIIGIIFIIGIYVGITGNKSYYDNCMRKIREIKKSETDKTKADEKLQTAGGVNTAIAISYMVTYFAILTIFTWM